MKTKIEALERLTDIVMMIFIFGAIVSLVVWFGYLGTQSEQTESTRFAYVFPDGMKPLEFIEYHGDRLNQLWLCETELGEYVECQPIVTEK